MTIKMAGDDVNEPAKGVHVELAKAKEILEPSIVVQRGAKKPRWRKDVLEDKPLKLRRRLTKKGSGIGCKD